MYWLDLVRYADTVGYHGDQEHAISPYRDYVIQAFNDNLPFDRFTREQLAGDLLPEATTDQKIASGYNRLLQTSHEGGVQKKEYLAKYSADRVRNLGSVWLGVTLGCAECHDHKFDPFTQRDFYRLAAVFADVDDLPYVQGADERAPARPDAGPCLVSTAAISPSWKSSWQGAAAAPMEQAASRPGAARSKRLRKQTRRTMITEAIDPRPIRVLAAGRLDGRGRRGRRTGRAVRLSPARNGRPADAARSWPAGSPAATIRSRPGCS